MFCWHFCRNKVEYNVKVTKKKELHAGLSALVVSRPIWPHCMPASILQSTAAKSNREWAGILFYSKLERDNNLHRMESCRDPVTLRVPSTQRVQPLFWSRCVSLLFRAIQPAFFLDVLCADHRFASAATAAAAAALLFHCSFIHGNCGHNGLVEHRYRGWNNRTHLEYLVRTRTSHVTILQTFINQQRAKRKCAFSITRSESYCKCSS